MLRDQDRVLLGGVACIAEVSSEMTGWETSEGVDRNYFIISCYHLLFRAKEVWNVSINKK